MSFGGGLEGKWPEHCVNHLWPHPNTMQEQSASRESKHLVIVFDNTVLMMSADGTEGYLLLLAIDLIQETLVSKGTIIGVIVLDGAVSLRHHFFKSFHCKDSLIDGKILH